MLCYSPSRVGSQEDDSKCDKVSGSFNTLNIDLFDRIFWLACSALILQIE